jgi:hypothetical protein
VNKRRVKIDILMRFGVRTVDLKLEDTGESPVPDVCEFMEHATPDEFRLRRLRDREEP